MKLPQEFSPEERSQKAQALFKQGFNCTQSVILAFADVLEASGIADEKLLKIIGSGFGGGMGRLREVCGAFSGCTMMAGFISPADVPAIWRPARRIMLSFRILRRNSRRQTAAVSCAANCLVWTSQDSAKPLCRRSARRSITRNGRVCR